MLGLKLRLFFGDDLNMNLKFVVKNIKIVMEEFLN